MKRISCVKTFRHTGTGPHFSAFSPEPPRSLLFPLLSHAIQEISDIRQTVFVSETHVVYNGRGLERGRLVASAVL